ncbi:MAG: hypothetical protein GXP62_10025, partial [Oligoflexia bacterium]|nr:hypothetical protein [Oligoflexia bacterium]
LVLAEPVVSHVLGLVLAGLDGRPATSPRESELVALLVRLTVEACAGELRAAAVPSLSMVAIAVATMRSELGELADSFTLSPAVLSHVQVLRERIRAAQPVELGRVMLDVARRLQLTLDWVDDGVGQLDGLSRACALARSILDDGLLLAMPRGPVDRAVACGLAAAAGLVLDEDTAAAALADPLASKDSEGAPFRAALRRFDVARALIDHLALLAPVGDGGWRCGALRVPDSVQATFLVPRGTGPVTGFVVAIHVEGVVAAIEGMGRGVDLSLLIQRDWRLLVDRVPQGLHVRQGGVWISVFRDGLAALTFARQAARTMSGPRRLDSLGTGPALDLDDSVRVDAALTLGPISGGTDGCSLSVQGAVVGRACALAAAAPSVLKRLQDLEGTTPTVVRCGPAASDEIAALFKNEADLDVLPIPDQADCGGLFIRGLWRTGSGQRVLVGRDSAVLIELAPGQLDAFLASRADHSGGSRDGYAPVSGGADASADEEVLFSQDRITISTDSDQSVLDSSLESFFDEQLVDRRVQTTGSGRRGNPDNGLPAWDATGFTLPEYSQEMDADELLPQLDETADPNSYSLEVDDDYGFEEDLAHGWHPVRQGPDPDSVSDPTTDHHQLPSADHEAVDPVQPGRFHDSPEMEALDFDVFAWPKPEPDQAEPASPQPQDSEQPGPQQAARIASQPASPPGFLPVNDAQVDIQDDAEDSAEDSAPADAPADAPGPVSESVSVAVSSDDLFHLFGGYVVVAAEAGRVRFGLRDGALLRDSHTYDRGEGGAAAYRSFVQAKVAESFVPRLDLWSPLLVEDRPEPLDPHLLKLACASVLLE